MNETQTLIKSMMGAVQFCRSCLNDGTETASEASLRDLLNQLQQEMDQFEAEISIKAASVNLYFDGLPPVSYYWKKFKNRAVLHFKNTDSAVAESMIRCSTDCIIAINRTKHGMNSAEPGTEQLFQRLQCCLNMSVRHFRAYL